MSDPLGSPEDLRTYREILDAIATEVPVVPLRFGTILTSEDAVAQELLAARHDEFTAALDRLEGRAEFQVKGRYVKDTGLEKVSAWREQDARTVQQALEGVCVASVTRQPTSDLDAVDVAFLVNVSDERRMERVTRALSRKWEGRVDLQLLGPMAAYDFTVAAQPESGSGLVRLSGKSILASGSGLSPCSCRLLSRWFDLAGMGGLVPWRSAEARAGLAAWRRGELSPWHHNHLRSREPLCWK
jgi:hypothetical protein